VKERGRILDGMWGFVGFVRCVGTPFYFVESNKRYYPIYYSIIRNDLGTAF